MQNIAIGRAGRETKPPETGGNGEYEHRETHNVQGSDNARLESCLAHANGPVRFAARCFQTTVTPVQCVRCAERLPLR